jgi:hypothetical protein
VGGAVITELDRHDEVRSIGGMTEGISVPSEGGPARWRCRWMSNQMFFKAAKMSGSDLKRRLHQEVSEVRLWPCRDAGEGLTDLSEALFD